MQPKRAVKNQHPFFSLTSSLLLLFPSLFLIFCLYYEQQVPADIAAKMLTELESKEQKKKQKADGMVASGIIDMMDGDTEGLQELRPYKVLKAGPGDRDIRVSG